MKNIILLIILFYLISCTKHTYKYTHKHYNNNVALVEINGVTVKKKQSITGHIIQAGSVVAGGYLGYKISPIVTKYNSDGTANTSAITGAAIGGLIGFGINNSINSALGRGHVFKLDKKDKVYGDWFKDFNNRGNYIPLNTPNEWLFMDKNKEAEYQIVNLEDLKFFHSIFPSSKFTDVKVAQAIEVFDRNSIEKAIALFDDNSIKNKLILAFLTRSSSAKEVYDVINKFPELKGKAEEKLAKLVSEKEEILSFVSNYPNSTYKNDLQKKINSSSTLFYSFSRIDLKRLLKYFQIEDKNTQAKYIQEIIKQEVTFSDVSEDIANFSEFKSQIELKATELINDLNTHNRFIYQFPNSKYIHVFEDGFIDSEKGKIVSTEWNFEKNTPPNFEKNLFVSSKEVYYGQYYGGKKSGFGTLDTSPEDIKTKIHYEGKFSNGEFNGEGKYTFGDGTYNSNSHVCNVSYSGTFKNSLFDGQGSATGILGECYSWFADNFATYSGGWKEGKFHGTGKYSYGEMWYEGGFERGAISGIGMMRLPNGIRIEGPWKEQNPNGRMHLFKFTLGGLIREDDYKEAYSFKDLTSVESNFIDKWNSSRSSTNTSTIGNDSTKESESSKTEANSEESDFEKCENISIPSVKKVGERGTSGFSYTFLITFTDGVYGTLYLGDPSGKYFISDGIRNYYYKSYEAAIRALYRYKKCEFISKIDRD